MLTDGSNIIIFDHEAAFGFVMDLVKNPKPWLIPQASRYWINEHFFYSRLRKHRPGFDLFFEKLSSLNQNFWDKLCVLLPQEWNTKQVEQIILTLKSIVDQKEIFQKEIKRILL